VVEEQQLPALEAVGPSVPVQRSGLSDAIPGGFQPQETAIRPTPTSSAINRCTPQA